VTDRERILRETIHEIRALALQALGAGYPRTLPLGMNNEHEIVKLCDSALKQGVTRP
jgi:hypothetical protein